MSEDREIVRELWNGQVPVQFVLAPNETESSIEPPQPYFVSETWYLAHEDSASVSIFGSDNPDMALVPRQTYFPLALDKVNRTFSKYAAQGAGHEAWLEFDGIPLKLHYPVGVLFDLFAYDGLLPWTLIVHYSGFPEHELVHLASRDAMEAYYIQTLKEADVLKHRNSVVSNMLVKDKKQLWTALTNDRFEQFWAINKKLMETPSDSPHFRFIPLRIYQPDKPFIQKLMKSADEDGRRLTLADALQHCLPEALKNPGAVLIQGLPLSHQIPLQWLSEHFSYPDNFLHICVHLS